MNTLKTLLLIMSLTSVLLAGAIIALTVFEVYADVKKLIKNNSLKVPYRVTVLSMFCLCNVLTLIHVLYLTQYTLRDLRYSWYVSCNYFLYVIWEIISVIIVFTTVDALTFPVVIVIAVLVAALFVLLFFFNCVTEKIFSGLESKIAAASQNRIRSMGFASGRTQGACVRVSLFEEGVNKGATISDIRTESGWLWNKF